MRRKNKIFKEINTNEISELEKNLNLDWMDEY